MIYADDMAYDEQEMESNLAVSIQLSKEEEIKQSSLSACKRNNDLDDLKSSYWMPV